MNELTDSTTTEQPAVAEITFDQLTEPVQQAARRAGWTQLMPVQARTIPALLAGADVMIQARTGSGKTGAFLLPLMAGLDPQQNTCQSLILVPTRELARQVWQEAQTLTEGTDLRAVAVYGGVGYGAQTTALKQGAQIVVGTPGRVLDHLLRRTLSLADLRLLVFDEADRMLSMGFYPDMVRIRRYLPEYRVQASMFSATFPAYVLRLAADFLHEPRFISLSSDHVHVTDTEHVFYEVPGMDKDRTLVRIIELENPASAIIFCNTKVKVHYVAAVLQRFGYDADELSADLNQNDRERVLERVRQGTLRFLVATDVAARGLDIPDLSAVIQYEIPEDVESYIHRAGRTGRAGASGVAISLVSPGERMMFNRIAKHYDISMTERSLPSDADVEAVVAERLTALLEARLRDRDKLQAERSQRFVALARALADGEDELPIITMLLDDTYQQLLHAPVTPPDAETRPARAAQRAAAPSRGRTGRSGGRRRA